MKFYFCFVLALIMSVPLFSQQIQFNKAASMASVPTVSDLEKNDYASIYDHLSGDDMDHFEILHGYYTKLEKLNDDCQKRKSELESYILESPLNYFLGITTGEYSLNTVDVSRKKISKTLEDISKAPSTEKTDQNTIDISKLSPEDIILLENYNFKITNVETKGNGDGYIISRGELNYFLNRINLDTTRFFSSYIALVYLQKNIPKVSDDFANVTARLSKVDDKDVAAQRFQKFITVVTSLLIVIIIALFFLPLILRKNPNPIMMNNFFSFNGLQFVTLFVVIICLVSFGIQGLIPGSELASILSAISGFILGKGIKTDPNPPLPAALGGGVVPPPQNLPAPLNAPNAP